MPANPSSDSVREEYYAIRTETVSELRKVVESLKTIPENGKNSELLAEIRKLEAELKRLKKTKRYGLVWEDKPEEFEAEAKSALPVLEEVGELAFSDGSDKPQNLIIEGDNFHSLAALSYTHKGLVDVIYIDPPYNTGNKDFVYNDRFVDKEDDFRHSKWLSFMEKRLRLARDLLKETGVIFISIDDNEQAQLKMLCDEVFGEGNFVAQVIWEKKYSPQNDSKYISMMHDYLLCYAKTKISSDDRKGWIMQKLERTAEQDGRYKNPDNDPRWPWKATDLSVRSYAKDYDFEVTTPSWRIVRPPNGRCWMTSKKNLENLIHEGRVWFGKTWGNVPSLKTYLSEVSNWKVPGTIWTRDEVGDNELGRKIIKEMNILFDSPKPTNLIRRVLELNTKDSLILDFFAGSGTTGHAVLQLNKEDGGSRRFILCSNRENTAENPDKNLCRDVCYQRVKRVAQGYENAKSEAVEGLGGSVRYFKTAFVAHSKSTDDLRHAFVDRCSDILRIKEDCFDAVPGHSGDAFRAYSGNGKNLALVYDPSDLSELKSYLEKTSGPVTAYVFAIAPEPFAEELAAWSDRLVLEPVPDGILSSYRKIYGI